MRTRRRGARRKSTTERSETGMTAVTATHSAEATEAGSSFVRWHGGVRDRRPIYRNSAATRKRRVCVPHSGGGGSLSRRACAAHDSWRQPGAVQSLRCRKVQPHVNPHGSVAGKRQPQRGGGGGAGCLVLQMDGGLAAIDSSAGTDRLVTTARTRTGEAQGTARGRRTWLRGRPRRASRLRQHSAWRRCRPASRSLCRTR